jgi:putative AdoMet-dependent methyltransferase
MSSMPEWQWDEFRQVGTDYADAAEVERYEQRMGQFRNIAAEDADILTELALTPPSRILEIGTGTGHFARCAGKAGHHVAAVDVSPAMLDYARARASADGLAQVQFHHAGFLNLPFDPSSFDAAVTVAALHHLPDVWKAVALANIHRVLKPGGRLVLRDIAFSWSHADHSSCFDAFVESCPASMRHEAQRHIAKEYSTLDWIMLGLLEHAGFRRISVQHDGSMMKCIYEK